MDATAPRNGRVNARPKAASEHKQKAQNYFGVPSDIVFGGTPRRPAS
jgi:hypothetical protein